MPERTCTSCRKKGEKKDFLRISEENGKYVFDKEMKVQSRGFYVCKNPACIERLSKNRKYNLEMQELLKLLKETEKNRKNIIDIIRPMKNSGFFVFGIDENIEGIKNNIEKKEEFLNVFSRNVNVVGITDKRVVNGILSKVEVTE